MCSVASNAIGHFLAGEEHVSADWSLQETTRGPLVLVGTARLLQSIDFHLSQQILFSHLRNVPEIYLILISCTVTTGAQTTSSPRAQQEPPGLVSWGCHHKVRRTRGLKTTNLLSPSFGGRKYEIKVSTGLHSFPRLSSRILPCFFQLQVASDISYACGHLVRVSASVFTWLLPVSLCVSSPLLGLKNPPQVQDDFNSRSLTDYICKDSISK
nr:uncharacterized protein LOC129045352 [Mirounga angustirostris]XP_054360077.1 uncharacterized protein LOC129045352 [Mirounga angustirostris]